MSHITSQHEPKSFPCTLSSVHGLLSDPFRSEALQFSSLSVVHTTTPHQIAHHQYTTKRQCRSSCDRSCAYSPLNLTHMNDTPNNANSPLETQSSQRLTRVGVPLEYDIYQMIKKEAAQLSLLLGFEITVPKFLRTTILENWTLQAERYRKLDSAKRKARL